MGRIRSCPPPRTITEQRTWQQSRRSGHPSSYLPIRAERPTLHSRTPPLGRNEAVGPPNRPLRKRPLNREALSDRLTLPTIPQRTTDHPEHTIERGNHDSRTNPEDNDARVDDEPFHHEAHRASAGVTTTREPMPGAHTPRVVEGARERDAVAECHFQSDLSSQVG
jgi:hypothetical protein